MRDGTIDAAACTAAPRDAFARRFWENEPDRSGALLRNSGGWNLAFPDDLSGAHHHLSDGAMRPGKTLDLTTPDGTLLPFRVVSIRPG